MKRLMKGENRIVEIHSALGLKNNILIRFNPDKSEDGHKPCFKKSKISSGEKVFRLYEPSWGHRIPILIRKSLHQALENAEVDTIKRKLFF